MKTLRNFFGSALLPLLVLFSCNDEDKLARLRISLIDSPGDYDAVKVDIQGVSIHVNENIGENGGSWINFKDSNVGVKNLLEYTGGKQLTLVDTEFPAATISQIRLLLGGNNSIVVDGTELPLKTPSGLESGLKLQVHETLQGGITYNLKLDFEVARSVIYTGNDEYVLIPVVKVITEARSGAIKGFVEPAKENVAIYITDWNGSYYTTYAATNIARFQADGIPEGQYIVTFDPGDNSQYDVKSIDKVDVSIGKVMDIGTIVLDEK
jgi:hypothetical protein